MTLIPCIVAYCLCIGPSVLEADSQYLFDFRVDDGSAWMIVNDGVMGGLSQSSFSADPGAFASFAGEVSLRNNGGFASVRAPLAEAVGGSARQIELRVRGDGRTYQVRLRTDGRFDGVAYRAEFATVPDRWMTVSLPLDEFFPTFRGRRVVGAPELRPADVRQLGLMIADKREGEFRLDVEWIRAVE